MQKPSVARIVHVLVNPMLNNGSDIAPAIITRVHSGTRINDTECWIINYQIFYDGNTVEWRTSGYMYETEEEARANCGTPNGLHCFWPTRV